MISHEYQVIFIHIPRTGGTSIEQAFGIDHLWRRCPGEKHLSASQAKNFYGKKIWKNYFKFSIVRNPWDRIVSLWKSKYYGNSNTLYDFLLHYRPAPWESRSLRCCEILDLELDFIARYETLDRDYAEICRRIGKKAEALPVLRASQHDHYSKYYDAQTQPIVGWLYRKDVQEYSYRFEPQEYGPQPGGFQKAVTLSKFYVRKSCRRKAGPLEFADYEQTASQRS